MHMRPAQWRAYPHTARPMDRDLPVNPRQVAGLVRPVSLLQVQDRVRATAMAPAMDTVRVVAMVAEMDMVPAVAMVWAVETARVAAGTARADIMATCLEMAASMEMVTKGGTRP